MHVQAFPIKQAPQVINTNYKQEKST